VQQNNFLSRSWKRKMTVEIEKEEKDYRDTEIILVKIDEIIIDREDRRKVNEEFVSDLAKSISEIGLINPITITIDKQLIAGLHRLEAFKLLSREEIPAKIAEIDDEIVDLSREDFLKLMELDENLVRWNGHYLDVGKYLAEKQEVYRRLYPETKREATLIQYRNETVSKREQPSFSQMVAEKLGLSPRTIEQEIQLSRDIEPEVQEFIKEKEIGKKEALLIAREEPEIQKEIVERITSGKVRKIRSAITQIKTDEKIEQLKKNTTEKELLGKIICGDFFEEIEKIEDNSIDLLFVDPPYNILEEEWDKFATKRDFRKFCEKWLNLVMPKVKNTGRIYICFSTKYQYLFYNLLSSYLFFGFNFAQVIIWHYKNNVKPHDKKTYFYAYDPIFYLYGKEAGDLNFTHETFTDTVQHNVWTIATPQTNFSEGKFHPTQKPLELLRRIILTGSKVGDTILDPFAGTGTTGVICEELGRKYILIEEDSEFVEIAHGRIKEGVK